MDAPSMSCVQCGGAVTGPPVGRRRRYCSRACRSRAYRQRVTDRTVVPVVPSAGSPPGGGPIDLATITSAAVGLADREGVDAVTMRRVAGQLGAGTMSLYRYVPSRDTLLDSMIDSVFRAHPLPDPEPSGWRAALERSAEQEWQLYRRHPWAAQVLAAAARPPIARGLMHYTDWRLRVLVPTGLDLDDAVRVTIAVSTIVQSAGIAVAIEHRREQEGGGDRQTWIRARYGDVEKILSDGDLPMVARFGRSTYAVTEPDSVFRFSLALLLDGTAALVARSVRRPDGRGVG